MEEERRKDAAEMSILLNMLVTQRNNQLGVLFMGCCHHNCEYVKVRLRYHMKQQ